MHNRLICLPAARALPMVRITMSETLAARIKRARKHAGLNQTELAERVGLSQQQISSLETGAAEETTALVKIARVCGVNPFWLDSGEGAMLDPLVRTDEALRQVALAMEPLADYQRQTAASIVEAYATEAQRKRVNE